MALIRLLSFLDIMLYCTLTYEIIITVTYWEISLPQTQVWICTWESSRQDVAALNVRASIILVNAFVLVHDILLPVLDFWRTFTQTKAWKTPVGNYFFLLLSELSFLNMYIILMWIKTVSNGYAIAYKVWEKKWKVSNNLESVLFYSRLLGWKRWRACGVSWVHDDIQSQVSLRDSQH